MNGSITAARVGRRALALGVVAGTLLAASLGFGADAALAAYKLKVEAGTLKVTGDAASDKLVLRLQPGTPTILQLDVGADGVFDFSVDRSIFTAIEVDARGGDDEVRVDQSAGSFPDEALTIDGGGGSDTLRGGSGAEILLGGGGDDVVAGGDGNDQALLGGGADTFTWNPGDDNDVVEGEAGSDRLDFNGNGAPENVELSANGSRARLTRNVASIVMDLNDIERVTFHAFGGSDTVVVHDLAGTGVRHADVDLHAVGGGGGDGQPDTVTARGTEGADRISLSSQGGYEIVSGLSAQVLVEGGEADHDNVNVATLGGEDTITTGREVFGPAPFNVDGGDGADVTRYNGTDLSDAIEVVANGMEVSTVAPLAARLDTTAVESLVVLGLGGADTITAVGNLAPLTALTLDGGDDGDILRGGNGADLLLGGGGDDSVDGNQGEDRALLGSGEDRFEWNPGDASDSVEGQAGSDTLDFFASNAGENVDISANGRRGRITRNVGNVTMDFDNVEGVIVRAFAGADAIVVGDLRGTDVATVDLDLTTFAGTGDTQADTIVVNGTSRRDTVQVSPSGSQVLVTGLAAQTRIIGGEAAYDTLRIQTLEGDDDVTVAPGVSDLIAAVVDLGTDE